MNANIAELNLATRIRRLRNHGFSLKEIEHVTKASLGDIREVLGERKRPKQTLEQARDQMLANIPDDWGGTIDQYYECVRKVFG